MIIVILWQHFYSKLLWSYAYNLSRLYIIIVVLRQLLCLTLSWSYAYNLTFYNYRLPLTTFNLTHHDRPLTTLALKRNEELTTRALTTAQTTAWFPDWIFASRACWSVWTIFNIFWPSAFCDIWAIFVGDGCTLV